MKLERTELMIVERERGGERMRFCREEKVKGK